MRACEAVTACRSGTSHRGRQSQSSGTSWRAALKCVRAYRYYLRTGCRMDSARVEAGHPGVPDAPHSVEEMLEFAGGFGRFQMWMMGVGMVAFLACGTNMLMPEILMPRVTEAFGIDKLSADLVGSIFFIGYIVGLPLWGILSDSRGRRPTTIIACFVMTLFGSCVFLAPVYSVLLLMRFMCGFGTCGVFNGVLVLTMEYCDSSKRAIAKSTFACFWSGSLFFLAFTGWLLQNVSWRWLITLQVPSIVATLVLGAWLPESARFYLVLNRLDQAMQLIIEVAETNQAELPFEEQHALEEPERYIMSNSNVEVGSPGSEGVNVDATDHTSSTGMRDFHRNSYGATKENTADDDDGGHDYKGFERAKLAREPSSSSSFDSALGADDEEMSVSAWQSVRELFSRAVLPMTIGVCWIHFSMSFSYYAIAFAGELISVSNFYVGVALGAVVEIPTHFLMFVFANLIGRKRTVVFFVAIVFLCVLLQSIPAITDASASAQTALTLIARMGSLGSANLMYVIAAECFPSTCRSFGMNFGAMAAHLGAVLAPVILDSISWGLILVCVLCCTVMASLLLLNETNGQELADK
ncbi:Synaptic vesicle 2-related protein [Porphyridium purpureum]|uniref:Synaptic vesicle 2-related protein n=1 Tax=Porphyridium purpureum TaxID=35688 RepID=A0A5J4Z5U9_PORPP|nr:Synaptic vesicle 2-related protein [Porphyridium purpureum]|eukprot:POR8070..scf295_1